MATRTWVLTDVDEDIYVDEIKISPHDIEGAAAGFAVSKRRLHGGLREGVDVVEVDNGVFRFSVVPTRGMGLWRAAVGGLRLGWRSPVRGPVHPAFVRQSEAGGLGWLDGFNELLVRCGLENNGAPEFDDDGRVRFGLHGKIANIPAHKVEVAIDGDSGRITVTGVVDETRLFFNKLRMTSTYTTTPGQPGVTIADTITNLSAEPGELELLYHTNFGLPLVDPGSKVVLPVTKVAPRDAAAVGNLDEWDTYGPETPGSAEAVFFSNLAADADGWTRAVLRNAAGNQGASLRFNVNQLPCFTLWKNRQAAADGYVTGLEPAINFPNVRSFEKEQGRVAVLAPGESRTFELSMEALPDASGVQAAERAVAQLQQGVVPKVLQQPDPQWSQG